jgi:hypothetical protein
MIHDLPFHTNGGQYHDFYSLLEWLIKQLRFLRTDIMADVKVDIKITVNPAAVPLTVDLSGVPSVDTVGVPYNGKIAVSGGTAPYTFTLTGGALPDGLALNVDGTITGTPTIAGSFDATIDIMDSATPPAAASVKTV